MTPVKAPHLPTSRPESIRPHFQALYNPSCDRGNSAKTTQIPYFAGQIYVRHGCGFHIKEEILLFCQVPVLLSRAGPLRLWLWQKRFRTKQEQGHSAAVKDERVWKTRLGVADRLRATTVVETLAAVPSSAIKPLMQK